MQLLRDFTVSSNHKRIIDQIGGPRSISNWVVIPNWLSKHFYGLWHGQSRDEEHICVYRDVLIEGTKCVVCLVEFRENENLTETISWDLLNKGMLKPLLKLQFQ